MPARRFGGGWLLALVLLGTACADDEKNPPGVRPDDTGDSGDSDDTASDEADSDEGPTGDEGSSGSGEGDDNEDSDTDGEDSGSTDAGDSDSDSGDSGSTDSGDSDSDSGDSGSTDSGDSGSDSGESGSTDSGDSGSDSGDSGDTDTDTTTTEPPPTCDGVTCSGHGSCILGPEGPECVCDPDYVQADDDSTLCVADESCLRLRALEEGCRQTFSGPAVVGAFVAVETCAGTGVTADRLGDLGLDFQIFENALDVDSNPRTTVDREVESYVALVIEGSDALVNRIDYAAFIDQVRDVVDSLTPGVDDPPTYVAIYVYGRWVQQYVGFTSDLVFVDDALEALGADPYAALVDPDLGTAWNGTGVYLYAGVARGLDELDRIRDLRSAVTRDGVLSIGTMVVFNGSLDNSQQSLDDDQIADTVSQVVAVGVEHPGPTTDLQVIGRDDLYLLENSSQWAPKLTELAQRIDGYPGRSHFLAYCSPAGVGQPEVTVTLTGGVAPQTTAQCEFDASRFPAMPPACTLATLTGECDTQTCGGVTACGACPDSECCVDGQCVGPSAVQACNGLDEMCGAVDQICTGDGGGTPYACSDPGVLDDSCGGPVDPACDPGAYYCDEGGTNQCIATKALGDACSDPLECESLSCQRPTTNDPFTCARPARIGEPCGDSIALCETGSHCQNGTCQVRRADAASCTADRHCLSGSCDGTPTYCTSVGACYWTWADKL